MHFLSESRKSSPGIISCDKRIVVLVIGIFIIAYELRIKVVNDTVYRYAIVVALVYCKESDIALWRGGRTNVSFPRRRLAAAYEYPSSCHGFGVNLIADMIVFRGLKDDIVVAVF